MHTTQQKKIFTQLYPTKQRWLTTYGQNATQPDEVWKTFLCQVKDTTRPFTLG